MIEAVRKVYDGPVTSCHTPLCDLPRELGQKDHWFYDLDSVSVSFYRPAAKKAGASVDEMVEALAPWVDYYGAAAEVYGKPFYFGECGCTSSTGGAMAPSSWKGGACYAPEEQANYIEAVCRSFWGKPWWYGLFWWKWDEQNDRPQFKGDPAGDQGFVVDAKPAAEVMKAWYGRSDR